MTNEDINWFEGKYPSWQDDIERSAKAAIEEIHKMAVEAMPRRRMGISCRMGIDVDRLGKLFNEAYDEYVLDCVYYRDTRVLDVSES